MCRASAKLHPELEWNLNDVLNGFGVVNNLSELLDQIHLLKVPFFILLHILFHQTIFAVALRE